MRDVYRGRQAAMGASGWEDTSDGRARSYRAGRQGDMDRSTSRGGDRSSRYGNPPPRMNDRLDRPSSRGWDDSAGRSSSRGERMRDDDWSSSGRPGSSSRNPRGGSDYDRGPRERSGGRDADPRERSGDRSMRGPRPGSRDADPRSRGGAPGGERRPGSGRGGGIWGAEDESPRRRRPDASDGRGRPPGARGDTRDPRNMRRGLVNLEDVPEEDEKKSLGFGKAALIVLVMLLVGIGGAYGYYTFTAPTVHNTTGPSNSTAVTPSVVTTVTASPSAAASSTPHS